MLHVEVDAPGAGPRLVLVHGFTQTRDCWGSIPAALDARHEIARVDAPGHGRSGHADADLWEAARLVGDAGGRAVYVGYSMGARICLHLALSHPDLVDALVLLGAHPGIADESERARRAADDEARARRIEEIGVAAFLDEWLALPMFADLPADAACREARAGNDARRLASALRHLGTGRQEPLWERLDEIRVPTLWMAGTLDAKFARLARESADRCGPGAAVALLDDCRHAAHLVRPEDFVRRVVDWLARPAH